MVQDTDIDGAPAPRGVRAGQLITEAVNLLDRGFAAAWPVWLTLAVIFICTDLVILIFGADKAYDITSAQSLALGVRSLGVLWVFVAGLRATVLAEGRWALDGDFWIGLGRMALVQTAILLSAGLGLRLIDWAINGLDADPHVARLALLWAAIALVIAIIPLEVKTSPWPISALAGERGVDLREAWRRSKGVTWAAVIAWTVLVLPFMLVHFALSAWIAQSRATDSVRILLTVVDCLVSVVESGLMIGVMAALYALTRARAQGRAGEMEAGSPPENAILGS